MILVGLGGLRGDMKNGRSFVSGGFGIDKFRVLGVLIVLHGYR